MARPAIPVLHPPAEDAAPAPQRLLHLFQLQVSCLGFAWHGMEWHGLEWHGIARGTMCGQSGVWALVLVQTPVWKHHGLRSMHVDSIVKLQ